MITSVSNKADLLIMPRKGGESDNATAKRPAAAGMQPDAHHAESEPVDRAAIDRVVVKVNEALKSADVHVKLLVDQDTKQVVVKVIKESGEVIRQVPSEEVLKLAKYLSQENPLPTGKGVLLKQQA